MNLRPISLLVLCSMLLLAGCTRLVYVPQTHSETIIDTLVEVRPDSSVIKALFECDSLGQVRIRELEEYKGKEADVDFAFKDGKIEIITRWKTQYIDRVHELRDTVTVVQEVERVREVKAIPSFYHFTFWWFWGTIGVGLIILGIKYLRGKIL